MIHPVTGKEIPEICPKTDCVKKKCLIRYMFESKYCESYENAEQRIARLQRELLQDDESSNGRWSEQYERLIMMQRQKDVLQIIDNK